MGTLLGMVLLVIPLWRICGRAGFHPALALVAIVPVLGLLVVAGILAFAEWPAAARRRLSAPGS